MILSKNNTIVFRSYFCNNFTLIKMKFMEDMSMEICMEWIISFDTYSEFFELLDHSGNLTIAEIRNIFLKRKTEYEHPTSLYLFPCLDKHLHYLICHIERHVIINLPSCENDIWMKSKLLSTFRKIIRVYSDTMSSYQSWGKPEKIPLGCCGLKDIECVDSDFVTDL